MGDRAKVAARVGRVRHRDLRRHDAAHRIAVGVGPGHEYWIGRTDQMRLLAMVDQVQSVERVEAVGSARDGWIQLLRLLDRYERPMVAVGVGARRRRDASGYPLVERDQQRAQVWGHRNRVLELLADSPVTGGV